MKIYKENLVAVKKSWDSNKFPSSLEPGISSILQMTDYETVILRAENITKGVYKSHDSHEENCKCNEERYKIFSSYLYEDILRYNPGISLTVVLQKIEKMKYSLHYALQESKQNVPSHVQNMIANIKINKRLNKVWTLNFDNFKNSANPKWHTLHMNFITSSFEFTVGKIEIETIPNGNFDMVIHHNRGEISNIILTPQNQINNNIFDENSKINLQDFLKNNENIKTHMKDVWTTFHHHVGNQSGGKSAFKIKDWLNFMIKEMHEEIKETIHQNINDENKINSAIDPKTAIDLLPQKLREETVNLYLIIDEFVILARENPTMPSNHNLIQLHSRYLPDTIKSYLDIPQSLRTLKNNEIYLENIECYKILAQDSIKKIQEKIGNERNLLINNEFAKSLVRSIPHTINTKDNGRK